MKHTILGAGGSIGNALTYELLSNKQSVRLVSRSKYLINGTDSFKADISSFNETFESVKGSDIVYLCVGLPYDYKIWLKLWPKIMKNTIDACIKANAKLIFFDNVYMYGKVDGKMTESTPYNPCSRKGEVRAKIANMLETEMKKGNIQAIIARAADLYGPYITKTSMVYVLVIEKLMRGKSAQWMVDVTKPHSFTYTIDCAKGLHLLISKNDTLNQIWHLPTFNPAINLKTFIEIVAGELGVNLKYSVLKKWMVKTAGVFDKKASELYEMLYQYEFDYHFDSSKFNEYFDYKPTPYGEGIKETIKFVKNQ
ncbi:MAG: NAD-dependent epimerase/dehydratase family protein [bacterium]